MNVGGEARTGPQRGLKKKVRRPHQDTRQGNANKGWGIVCFVVLCVVEEPWGGWGGEEMSLVIEKMLWGGVRPHCLREGGR